MNNRPKRIKVKDLIKLLKKKSIQDYECLFMFGYDELVLYGINHGALMKELYFQVKKQKK